MSALKTWKVFLMGFFFPMGLMAQQETMNALYPFFASVVNPGLSGQGEDFEIKTLLRRKPLFRNFGGQVNQQFLSMDIPYREEELGMGLGIYANNLNESFGYVNGGISSNFSLGMAVSKKIILDKGLFLKGGVNYAIHQFPFLSSNGKSTIKSSFGWGLVFEWENFSLEKSRPSHLLGTMINANVGSFDYMRANYVFPKSELGQLRLGLARVKKYGLAGKWDLLIDYWWKQEWGFGLYYLGSGSDVFTDSFYGVVEYRVNRVLGIGYGFDIGSMNSTNFGMGSQLGGTPSGFHQLYLRIKP